MGILDENPYVFAYPNKTTSPLRATDSISKIAGKCNLVQLELICCTKLRKYTATMCQVLNLQETEIEWLANHLGHSIRVHREFYSFKDSTAELTKVSKLLLAIDEGNIGKKWMGKTLNEIKLEEINIKNSGDEDDAVVENRGNDAVVENRGNDAVVENRGNDAVVEKRRNDASQDKNHESERKGQRLPLNRIRKWSKTETSAVWSHFRCFIREKKVPGKKAALRCIEESGNVLKDRSWKDIKFKVKNIISSL